MNKIILKEKRYELCGKVTYREINVKQIDITYEQYQNIINSCSFFRRLGGSETLTYAYTSRGYTPIKLISKSPDKLTKVVREFEFN